MRPVSWSYPKWLSALVAAVSFVVVEPAVHAAKPAKPASKADAKKAEPKKPASKPDAKKAEAKKAEAKKPASKPDAKKKAPKAAEKPCVGPSVTLDRGGLESETVALTDCKGKVRSEAVDRLSVLARPFGTSKPGVLGGGAAGEVAPGILRLSDALVDRLAKVAEKFPARSVTIVSGTRPQSKGSQHQGGRAIDVRLDGVKNEDLMAFCKTLDDTGCGLYPNSAFVHMDARDPGAGTLSWIDAAGPGEEPRYVSAWPIPAPAPPALPATPAPTSRVNADGDRLARVDTAELQALDTVRVAVKPAGRPAAKPSSRPAASPKHKPRRTASAGPVQPARLDTKPAAHPKPAAHAKPANAATKPAPSKKPAPSAKPARHGAKPSKPSKRKPPSP